MPNYTKDNSQPIDKPIIFRQLKINKDNYLWRQVRKAGVTQALLNGNVLVIDPSIGSLREDGSGSLPGYAIYVAGRLTDSGVITVPRKKNHHNRLWEIGRSLREDFPPPNGSDTWDVLIVEEVPQKRFRSHIRGSGSFGTGSQVPLHRATGAVLASVKTIHSIMISPATWHLVVPEDYVKSDNRDAIAMGEAVLQYARVSNVFNPGGLSVNRRYGKKKKTGAKVTKRKDPITHEL